MERHDCDAVVLFQFQPSGLHESILYYCFALSINRNIFFKRRCIFLKNPYIGFDHTLNRLR